MLHWVMESHGLGLSCNSQKHSQIKPPLSISLNNQNHGKNGNGCTVTVDMQCLSCLHVCFDMEGFVEIDHKHQISEGFVVLSLGNTISPHFQMNLVMHFLSSTKTCCVLWENKTFSRLLAQCQNRLHFSCFCICLTILLNPR